MSMHNAAPVVIPIGEQPHRETVIGICDTDRADQLGCIALHTGS